MANFQNTIQKVAEAKALIECHTHEAIDVAQLALTCTDVALSLSPHLSKTFSVSPYHYSLKVRLNRANTLIAHQKYTITEAAFATGFSDISSFSKTYKNTLVFRPVS